MSDIILHHYPPSPISEKVRIALGIKGLAWRSVEIPRVPPKPFVMPLTGGYRRTPVMQIGADIYCDSHCILREIQRRYPEPTFTPGGADGLPWAINRWSDHVFEHAVRLSLGANADQLPDEFAKDRARLFLGPDGDVAALKHDVAHLAAQVRAQFAWIDERLRGGRRFLLGDAPASPTRRATTWCGSSAAGGAAARPCSPVFRPSRRGNSGSRTSVTAGPSPPRRRRPWRSPAPQCR